MVAQPIPTGGDVWVNTSSSSYLNPVLGNYAWLTIIHETGHTLGLKHPHEAQGPEVLDVSFAAHKAPKVPVSAQHYKLEC